MNFGEAIKALNEGKLVAREGWNGKGMWLYKSTGNILSKDVLSEVVSMPKCAKIKLTMVGCDLEWNPAIVMFTADQKLQPGWLASQTDMLATDWEIVDFTKG